MITAERGARPGADTSPALLLDTKGGHLSARAAGGIITAIAGQAALDDDPTAHVLGHSSRPVWCAARPTWSWSAELMGHSRLDTTRQYSLPAEQDQADALNHLATDH